MKTKTESGDLVVQKKENAVTYVPFAETQEITVRWQDVTRWIQVETRSGAPASDKDIFDFMWLCKAQRLNPFVKDAYLVGYDSKSGPSFSVITAYQALAKRAELHEQYDGMEAGCLVMDKSGELHERKGAFILDDDSLVGAWCRLYRKDRQVPYEVRIKRSAFDTRRSRWAIDPEGMLVKCAKAAAIREMFPSTTSGLYLREEHDRRDDSAPATARASSVNAVLEAETEERTVVPEAVKVSELDDLHGGDVTEVMKDCEAMLADCETMEQIDAVEESFGKQKLNTAELMAVSGAIEAKRKQVQA